MSNFSRIGESINIIETASVKVQFFKISKQYMHNMKFSSLFSANNFSKKFNNPNSTIGLWLSGLIDIILRTFKHSFNKFILSSWTFGSGLFFWPLYKRRIKANKESKALDISSLIFVDIGETIWLLNLSKNKCLVVVVNFLLLTKEEASKIFWFSGLSFSSVSSESNWGFDFLSSVKWLLYDSSILFLMLFNIAVSTLKLEASSFFSGSFSFVVIFSTVSSKSFTLSLMDLSSFPLYILIVLVKSSLVIKFFSLTWAKLLSSFTIELRIDNSLSAISIFSFSFMLFSCFDTLFTKVLIKSGSSWIILSTL